MKLDLIKSIITAAEYDDYIYGSAGCSWVNVS
jgi:hypothetical protein